MLHELDGTGREKYMDKQKARLTVDKDGNVTRVKTFVGMHVDLLKMCLRDEEGGRIEDDVINALPSSAQQELFDQAQRLSALNLDTDKDEAKND